MTSTYKSNTWSPTFMPVEPYPEWRLVNQNGTFKRDPQGRSLVFHTREEAVAHQALDKT